MHHTWSYADFSRLFAPLLSGYASLSVISALLYKGRLHHTWIYAYFSRLFAPLLSWYASLSVISALLYEGVCTTLVFMLSFSDSSVGEHSFWYASRFRFSYCPGG
ncbi:hypothetical protein [Sutcliffiella cohnii]|uniref:hypothetical protein n=1 Tax=Sutcliffiella cohnii TaxID=33932 RepID=UPI002E1CF300|nr:hypothetical protein [Sutcliffiella cohnii]